MEDYSATGTREVALNSTNNKSKVVTLSIVIKGLTILSCALAVQIFFFLTLHNLSAEAERLGRSQTQQIELIDCIDGLRLDISEYNHTLAHSYVTVGKTESSFTAYEQSMEKKLSTLEQLYGDRPEVKDMVASIKLMLADQQSIIHQMVHTEGLFGSAELEKVYTLFRASRNWASSVDPLMHSLAEKFDAQVEKLNVIKQQVEANRKSIDQEMYTWAAVDIIITGAVIVWFLRDITNRLRMLVANAQWIPTMKPLPLKVAGRDELSYLDGVLHDVAAQLRNATDYRNFLTQMVAHDLRSPLLAARLAVQMMIDQEDAGSRESRSKQLHSLDGSMNRLVALIEDLLTIDKLEAGKLELSCDLIDAPEVIEESFASLRPLATKKNVILQSSVGTVVVEADRARLLQVFNNLVSNAIKHSPDGAIVQVSATAKPDRVVFSVSDKGRGISEDQQARIFNRYQQLNAEDAKSGFGLGLTIAKSIVGAHGGEMGVESSEGCGAKFWFSLPSRVDLSEDCDTTYESQSQQA